MASRQNLLQCAVCVITSKITKRMMSFFVIVRFKKNNFISSGLLVTLQRITRRNVHSCPPLCLLEILRAPFCGCLFRRLGAHLSLYDKRNGRYYSAFQATRGTVSRPAGGVCPQCGHHFKRLDTHLRVSATCREVAHSEQLVPASPGSAPPPMNAIHSHTPYDDQTELSTEEASTIYIRAPLQTPPQAA